MYGWARQSSVALGCSLTRLQIHLNTKIEIFLKNDSDTILNTFEIRVRNRARWQQRMHEHTFC